VPSRWSAGIEHAASPQISDSNAEPGGELSDHGEVALLEAQLVADAQFANRPRCAATITSSVPGVNMRPATIVMPPRRLPPRRRRRAR
jgi:hypothetical protein